MRYKIPESVLVVIHTPDLQVLLIERADRPGFWQSVTGSLDAEDEPLAATAAREVAEETGIVASRYQLTDWQHTDRKSTRLNSSHTDISRMPSSA